jgi:outer membrane beta-barrel protein
MKKTLKLSLTAAAICGAGMFLLPSEAQAKKPGVLEGKPIVVDRLELRKFRVQVVPVIGMSLSQPFVHKGLVGAKVRFDFTVWIGIRGSFLYGAIDVESKLLKALNDGGLPLGANSPDAMMATGEGPFRPTEQFDNPAPLRHDFQAGLTKLQLQASLDVAFTPFAGKLGLFSAVFTEYDIYIFGGIGFVNWARHYPDARSTVEQLNNSGNPDLVIPNSTDPNLDNYCENIGGVANSECLLNPVDADDGFRVGGSFGAGLHLFITDWLSINPEVHDIVVAHNDAGLNATIDDVPPTVQNGGGNGSDRVARHNVSFNLGFAFYLPPKAKRSRLEQKLRGKKQSAAAAAGGASVGGDTSGGAAAEEEAPPEEGGSTDFLE